MKKILRTIFTAGSLLMAAGAYAQGTISFNNAAFPITTNAYSSSGLIKGAGNYIFGLYLAPDAGSLGAVATPVMLFTNSALPGIISISTYTLPNGYAAGTTYAFEVKGWSSIGGYGSWETAIQGNPLRQDFGISEIGTVTLGGGTTPAGIIWGNTPGTIQGFTLGVPEPSTIALAGLGAASLLLFRRRK